MNTKETLLFLANFNSWRRGDDSIEMPDPAEIGAAIDDAVNFLRNYDQMEQEVMEHARLLGKSGEREAALLARIDKLEREVRTLTICQGKGTP